MALCEKCVASNCYSAPCNLDCRHYGTWCETIVMAGGDAPFDKEFYLKAPATYDHAEFSCQRVIRLSKRLADAGVRIGDTITHINKQFADTTEEFGKLVNDLPAGTELRLIRGTGVVKFVTLK